MERSKTADRETQSAPSPPPVLKAKDVLSPSPTSSLPSRFHYCPTPPLIWARVGGHAR